MIINQHRGVLILIALFVYLCAFLFMGLQTGTAHTRTDRIPPWAEEIGLDDANTAGYRNSLLGIEFHYPADWTLDESTSKGYPYIRITNPGSPKLPASASELKQMAIIEISAEVYQAQEPVVEYLKSFIPIDASRGDPLSSIETEDRLSYTWGVEGLSLVFDEKDLFYHCHAALVDYPESKLILQIRLTLDEEAIEHKLVYLETFNQILASIVFFPPLERPPEESFAQGGLANSDPMEFVETSGNQFLTLPFEYQPEMRAVQGWIYTWGYRHNGVDYIRGIPSSPSSWSTFDVLAAADGVACVNCVYGPGNKVWIKHTLGSTVFYTYYGHLSTIDPSILKYPAVVTRGQKIGTAGNTGTTYIHLHFGVYNASWSAVDPYALYTTSPPYYPNPNYKRMGENHLFTNDPPLFPTQAEIYPVVYRYLPFIIFK